MIPIPSTALGPRCIPGPNDTATTPNRCLPGEAKAMGGPCVPCPGTPGSDCSRCDNNWDGTPAFPPRADGAKGNDHAHAIRDIVKYFYPELLPVRPAVVCMTSVCCWYRAGYPLG
jgi:hypothetical protein